MAIPWMVVLQNIPWREVITNAPRVADEAKKLWTNLSRQRSPLDAKTVPSTTTVFSGEGARDLNLMQTKILSLEAQVADLHAQMLESTKLINALAAQNAEFANHIEKNRRRIRLLMLAFFVLLAVFAIMVWRTL